MSATKIDAHVQHTASGWQTFRTFQPGLKCETPDHLTCKLASERLEKEEAEKSQEQRDAEAAERAAAVEASAEAQKRNLHQDRVDEAGRRKWEQIRIAGARKTVAINTAESKAASKIAAAKAVYEEAARAAHQECEEAVNSITEVHIAAVNEANAHDWLAEVEAEEAAKVSGENTGGSSAPAPSQVGEPAPAPGESAPQTGAGDPEKKKVSEGSDGEPGE